MLPIQEQNKKLNEILENQEDVALEVPKGSFKVVRAALHQPLKLPTAGGPTEASLYAHKGVTMWYHSSGLFCEYKNEWFIVPLANVVAVYTTYNKPQGVR